MRPPLIALAPHAWQDRWLSRQHLLSRLAALGWPVLYSFGPLTVWERHTPLWRQAPWRGRFVASDGVWLDQPGRWPPDWPGRPWWHEFALDRHAARLRGFFAGQPTVAVLFHPRFWPYVARLRPARVVYHVYDVFSLMEEWRPRDAVWERELVERADLITTSSPDMAAWLPGSGPARARVLENGGDVGRCMAAAGAPCPVDLAAIPHPRIGYAGTLNAKVDFAMVREVAGRRPDWHWIFMGPVLFSPDRPRDRQAQILWQQCLALPNVHYLGRKERLAVPAYLHHLDVHAICYRIAADDWVVHGYPVKFHECLATGRPVVAAPQSVLRQKFSHVTALAASPAEWLAALGSAMAGDGVGSESLRRQVALANGWEARAATLDGWLREMVPTACFDRTKRCP